MNVEYRELPGMTQIWLDFLSGFNIPSLLERVAELKSPKKADLSQYLLPEDEWCSARTVDNIRRLQCADIVAVVATVGAHVLGGDASQILKCLTAIKLSEELQRRSLSAVPVCLVDSKSIGNRYVFIIDGRGGLNGISSEDSDPVSGIEEIEDGAYDPETVQFLRRACSPDTALPLITARIFSGLMKDWGLVALIGDAQSFFSKTGVHPLSIVGPYESLSQKLPAAWPSISATVMDSRSRKTLEKYKLGMVELFPGEKEAMNKIQSNLPGPSGFSELKSEVEQSMAELSDPVSSNDELMRARDSCREKIIYQIEKLQKSFEAAKARRLEAASRQVHRACNFLAPNGSTQERELAGIYFPLRFSPSVLHQFYDQLETNALNHQLITMD
jgi:hypothetical protein